MEHRSKINVMLPSLNKILRVNSSKRNQMIDKRVSQTKNKATGVATEDSVSRHKDSLKRFSELKLPNLPEERRRKIEHFRSEKISNNSEIENVTSLDFENQLERIQFVDERELQQPIVATVELFRR